MRDGGVRAGSKKGSVISNFTPFLPPLPIVRYGPWIESHRESLACMTRGMRLLMMVLWEVFWVPYCCCSL